MDSNKKITLLLVVSLVVLTGVVLYKGKRSHSCACHHGHNHNHS